MTPTTDEILQRFAAHLKSRDRQLATVDSYRRDAAEFLRYLEGFKLPLQSVEPETLIAFRDHLAFAEKDKENSVRRKIIGIRQFFRFLAGEKLIAATPFDEMPLPERDDSLKKPILEKQIDQILRGTDVSTLKAARDIAILKLLAFEGLKANELIEIRLVDYVASRQAPTLAIVGTKNRTLTLSPETDESLTLYLRYFKDWLNAQTKEQRESYRWLFVSFKGKDGSLVLPQMTRHGLKFLLYELGEKFDLSHLNTENLRHFAIERFLTRGWDVEAILHHLGLRRLGNVGKHLARRRREVS